jgi:hypothetical protein
MKESLSMLRNTMKVKVKELQKKILLKPSEMQKKYTKTQEINTDGILFIGLL